jgi:hypothetical protein
MPKAQNSVSEVEVLGVVLAALKKIDEQSRQMWVINAALSNLGLSSSSAMPSLGNVSGSQGSVTPQLPKSIPGESGSNAHARAFLRSKAPKNAMQQVACLAYYLAHFRQTTEFKTKDISQMNKDAGGTPLSNTAVFVKNAFHKASYLAPAGGGRKLLTAFGEDVVNALPSQEAVKAVEENRPRKRRKRKGRRGIKGG